MAKKFRSFFEQIIAAKLKDLGAKFKYEDGRIPFIQPAKKRSYKPDFTIEETGVIIEAKGRLTKADRDKLKWLKEQHPEVRIVILFQKPYNTLRRGSTTTYADWCDKAGIEWAGFDDGIPQKWLKK